MYKIKPRNIEYKRKMCYNNSKVKKYGGKNMFESKYSKVLTVILVIVIIAIIGLLGFLGYDFYQKYFITKEASEFVDNYQGDIASNNDNTTNNNEANNQTGNIEDLESTPGGGTTTTTTGVKQKYKNFDTVGTITIPAISVEYPILEDMTRKALETSVVMLYPTNSEYLNEPGNCVIVGHNYRNGVFFSNLKRLNNGDKITIKDYKGGQKTYSVYNKFETTDTDTSFYQRDTGGKAEITLSTCTDASNNMRTIILAREE